MTRERRTKSDRGDVHRPVLVDEVLAALTRGFGDAPRGWLLDGTVGAGGHAQAVLERFAGLNVVGCDWDDQSLEEARRTLLPFDSRVELVRAPLADIEGTCAGRSAPLAVLADLGVCSMHFDRAERGFSVLTDGPLDMRMDSEAETTAADIVNRWSEVDLADLFFQEGGERKSRRAAAAIVAARRRVPFKRTAALAQLLADVLGPGGRIHPATRVFQALRRAVNSEGAQLDAFLSGADRVLAPGGVLLVITFHSGEDGVVKRFLDGAERAGRFESLTGKPIEPSGSEVRRNARARSARLRAARRTAIEPQEDVR